MKKIILLALTAIYKKVVGRTLFNGNTYYWGRGGCCILVFTTLIMIGCVEVKSKVQEEKKILRVHHYYAPNGCEYYLYGNGNGGIPIHKQDCKVCKERREKELEELIDKLKEK